MRFLHALRSIGVMALAALGSLAIIAALAYGAILARPQLFFNGLTLDALARVASHFDVQLTWKDAAIQVSSRSLTTKELQIAFHEFCYRHPRYRMCFDDIELTVALRLDRLANPIVQLGPGKLHGGDIYANIPPSTDEEAKEPPKPRDYRHLFQELRAMQIKPFELRLDKMEILTGERHFKGRSQLIVSADESQGTWTLGMAAEDLHGIPVEEMGLSMSVQAPRSGQHIPQILAANLQARLQGKGLATVNLMATPSADGSELLYDLGASLARARQQIKLASEGRWRSPELTGTVRFSVAGVARAVRTLVLEPCQYRAVHQPEAERFLTVSANCRGQLERGGLDREREIQALLSRDFDFGLGVELALMARDERNFFDSSWQLDVDKKKHGPVGFGGSAHGNIAGVLGEPLERLQATAELDMEAQIPLFKELVRRLHTTDWAIPAPLNALDGSLGCHLRGRFRTANGLLLVPFDCSSNLGSRTQKLVAQVAGSLDLALLKQRRQPLHLTGDVVLKDVRFVLPRVQIGRPMPRLVYDKRITLQAAEAKPKPPMVFYDFAIRTARHDSVQIATNLLENPIPIALSLRASSDNALSGNVRIVNYDAELFRREAFVKRLVLRLEPSTSAKEVEGEINIKTVDYDVNLVLAGTLAKPSFQLYSNPPLPQTDIMALLLFGRTPQDLDMDQRRSVEETRAAAADGAIGLISMFYLASTPIESVGYNPHTGMFTAKVSLGRGMSLTVGAGSETEQRIGLRRRLGRNWSVETTAIRDKQDESTRGVAMFTWSRRY